MGDADDSREADSDRRRLIKRVLLTAAAGYGGSQAGNVNVLSYLTNLASEIDESSTSPRERNRRFRSIFGHGVEEFSIDEGIVHHQFEEPNHHEDNLRTSIGLSTLLAEVITALPVSEAKTGNNPEFLNRNVISIGSIESNFAARHEYESLKRAYGPLDSLLRWRIRPNDSVETKRYVMNSKSLRPATLTNTWDFGRFDGNRDIWTSGNSGVRDYRNGVEKVPQIYTGDDRRGFIDKDLLLVSKLPNVITPTAADSGSQFVQFAGTHGIGTRGILEVLRSQQLLDDLEARAQETQYFQAIFVVDAVHEHRKTDSVPRRVEPADRWFGEWFHEVEL
ncbi:hypothetical protein [Halorussus caseinilyticus]|uniref:Uncharacterized protein n=1 Tax=Halorussus caseinilyticus TaxID=3034025 RepID=A0ABD5WE74_9EURY|nr:hypothetical protein [Halorussus sp. DT72]